MTVIPSRLDNLSIIVPVLAGQVDTLYIHVNGYSGEEVPAVSDYPNVKLTYSQENLGPFMKLRGMPGSEADWFFSVDDDIKYPANYVEQMVKQAEKIKDETAVCVHGSIFDPAKGMSRHIFAFSNWSWKMCPIMLPGTGTCAYPKSAFLNEDDFKRGMACPHGTVDPFMMCHLWRKSCRLWLVRRPPGWLTQLTEGSTTLWKEPRKGAKEAKRRMLHDHMEMAVESRHYCTSSLCNRLYLSSPVHKATRFFGGLALKVFHKRCF